MWLASSLASVLLAAAPTSTVHDELQAQCLLRAADPKNPWALAHGMVGFGKSYLTKDGRRAADVMIHDFLGRRTDAKDGALGFDRYAPDGTPIEPHKNLITKTLVLSGYKPTDRFSARFGTVTLADLIHSVELGFQPEPDKESFWEDTAWTLDLLAVTHPPGPKQIFTNGKGERIDLSKVMDETLSYLERAQADLFAGMDGGQPVVPKRKQGLYAHSCGGMHLVQAMGSWARYPTVRKAWGARFTRQIDVLFYRIGSESKQYDEALQKAPSYALQLRVQELKFYGHVLETLGRLKTESGFVPNANQAHQIQFAKVRLDATVRALVELNAFERTEQLAKSEPQLALDLVGDSCHALHGLNYWK